MGTIKKTTIFAVGQMVADFCTAANVLNARGAEWSWACHEEDGFMIYAEFDTDHGPCVMFECRWEDINTVHADLFYALLYPTMGFWEKGENDEQDCCCLCSGQ